MKLGGLINELLLSAAKKDRYILGLTGPPAAGKSTLAEQLVTLLNAKGQDWAIAVPMDGYHFSNDHLNELGLLHLKGVPASFDASAFVAFVASIRHETEEIHSAPEFLREIEASIPNAIVVRPQHKFVIVEGNYLLLDEEPWDKLQELMDETWFLSLKEVLRNQRLLARHVANGRTEDEAHEKIMTTDAPNAQRIDATKKRATRVVNVS